MALDPAVNLVFQKMKSELHSTKEQLEQAQSDLSAWKFTPDRYTLLFVAASYFICTKWALYYGSHACMSYIQLNGTYACASVHGMVCVDLWCVWAWELVPALCVVDVFVGTSWYIGCTGSLLYGCVMCGVSGNSCTYV